MRQLVSEKKNSEFKPVKLYLKIDLVSYPARAEGLVNRVNKRKQVDVRQLFNQVPQTAWVSEFQSEIGCQRSENQLQTEGLGPL